MFTIYIHLKQILNSLNICASIINYIYRGHTDRPKIEPFCAMPALNNLQSKMFGQERQTVAER